MTFGRDIQQTQAQSLHVYVFMQVCFFINFSSFKTDTENNANFDDVPSKHENFDAIQYRRQNFYQKLHECKGYNARQFITEFPQQSGRKTALTGCW